MTATIDEALDIMHRTSTDLSSWGSNHAPMVVEALCTMGRPDAVIPWIEGYKHRFQDRPRSHNPVAREDWRASLGDASCLAAWVTFDLVDMAGDLSRFLSELTQTCTEAILPISRA